jgi:U3 small nucleolar RNA-associated protein 10
MTTHPKSAVIRNAPKLFDLFLKALDQPRVVRAAAEGEEADFDEEELERLQYIYHEVALVMVMKLNDATLRPFIVKLAEWAGQLPKKDAQGRKLRSTSLFGFLASLFGKLKGLVTGYATYILDLTVEILANTALEGDDEVALLRSVLAALTESFEHDDESFWQSPHHFTPILTPLVTLLTTSAVYPTSSLTPRVHTALLTLASATSAQDQHKALNSALLKLLRHEDGKVRLAAVKLERELSERLSDEWMGMLPEMLPFVAELMEDDEREVERAGREWVRYLEGVLGETLDLS